MVLLDTTVLMCALLGAVSTKLRLTQFKVDLQQAYPNHRKLQHQVSTVKEEKKTAQATAASCTLGLGE